MNRSNFRGGKAARRGQARRRVRKRGRRGREAGGGSSFVVRGGARGCGIVVMAEGALIVSAGSVGGVVGVVGVEVEEAVEGVGGRFELAAGEVLGEEGILLIREMWCLT